MAALSAQESVPAAGGDTSNTSGSVSYSVGQVVYNTHTGNNGTVAEGVHQPYEISVVVGIKEANDINLSFTVYPNPAHEFLTLEVNKLSLENLACHLYDPEGKMLKSTNLIESRTNISLTHLAPGIYFLKVTDNNRELKTFKIIKNQ
jgi:hypothetical protein